MGRSLVALAGPFKVATPLVDFLPMLRRARFTVAYDGAAFNGFAENEGVPTVMGALRQAIERVVREQIEMVGAGRTDTGVHGWGQVVSVDLAEETDLDTLRHRVNRMIGPRVVMRDIRWTDPSFSARFTAEWRHYRYHVLNVPDGNPFLAATSWHIPQPLNMWAMNLACDPLIGEHDFSSFCRRPKVREGDPEPSMHRRVMQAGWRELHNQDYPGLLRFEIRANAFCQQMVRSVVGTLIEVGLGKLHAGDVRTVLLSRNRAAAGQVAPPHGLVLWEVGYPAVPLPPPTTAQRPAQELR